METISQISAEQLVSDNSLTGRSLDLSSLDDIPEERVLSGKSSEEKWGDTFLSIFQSGEMSKFTSSQVLIQLTTQT